MILRFAITALVLLLVACSAEERPVAGPDLEIAPGVETMTLHRQAVQVQFDTVGMVQSAEQIELSAEVEAPVVRVHIREGQRVKAGELLIELDAEKLQLRADKAKENLKLAESRSAEASAALRRREQLALQQTLSEELLENARHDHQRSLAVMADAKAALSLAIRDLNDAKIASPVDAVVEKQWVEVGEAVRQGSNLLTLQATSGMEVQTYVSERKVNYLSESSTAMIHIEGWQPSQYPALVQTVGVAADTRTGNFPVTLLMTEIDNQVRPGMTAKVRFVGETVEGMLLLPEKALVDRNRQAGVFVYRDGVAELRQPRIKAGLSDQLLVLEGLDEGDRIIVSGLDTIIDGSAVSLAAE